ncbi:hypothetical protein BCR44DRAFT_1535550 [Catenaria anguillulae PL171]|uniref:Adhesin domain-containing protein n=1 Tax=Catenaria anguillulae PL171 TaxID=765915 RepID=A0A1Y2HEQ5_9FUNG|nr:hypothetical protein BCR44DRAFT_1535550 [Catenaria anguillulae PL171]
MWSNQLILPQLFARSRPAHCSRQQLTLPKPTHLHATQSPTETPRNAPPKAILPRNVSVTPSHQGTGKASSARADVTPLAPANLYAYGPVDNDSDNDDNDIGNVLFNAHGHMPTTVTVAAASAKDMPPPDYYGTISTPATATPSETAGLVVNHHHYHHYPALNSPTSTTFSSPSPSPSPASCTTALASFAKRTLLCFTRAVAICCCFAILTILLAALTAGSMVHFAPGRLPGLSGDPAATVVDGVEWPCGGSTGVDPIHALRQQWIVSAPEALKVNVSGIASGAVRYAGFDVDPDFAVAGSKVIVDVSVHVSHERLIPLVAAHGDTSTGSVKVETPESHDMSRIFRECVIASVNVSMVHSTSSSSSRSSNALVALKSLQVDTVNLNHYLSSMALRRRSPASSSAQSSSSRSISTKATSQTKWTGLDSLAITTTNGHIQLTPSGPWSIHSSLSLTTTNGNIDLAGPLKFAGPRLDALSTNGNLHLRAMLVHSPLALPLATSLTSISVVTTNGNIDLGVADLVPAARVTASATNGNVLVTAGPDAALDSVKLRAATALGNAQVASRAAGWPRKAVKGNGWMGGVAELVLRKVNQEEARK